MTDTPEPLSIQTEIIIVLLLVIVNGIFAMTEMAMVSSRKTRLQNRADKGDTGAQKALDALKDPNRFLSSIQIGITLVGILAGVFGGATVAKNLGVWLSGFSAVGHYGPAIGIGAVVVGITYLSLVLGELVPKRLALNNAEAIASFMATPMSLLTRLAAPIIFLLSLSTNAILTILRVRHEQELSHTEDEIKILIEESTQAGVFEKSEQDIVNRALSLGDRNVNDLMTPRPDIVSIDIEDRPEEMWEKITTSRHSQFPVYSQDPDNILGIVSIKDLCAQSVGAKGQNLQSILMQPLFVPESLQALKVLELFKQSRTHVALVVDEYGTVQGIVTLHDILEAMVGDLPSTASAGDSSIVLRKDGSWLIDGLLSIDKFKEVFHISVMPQEDMGLYHTIAGYMLFHFNKIPSTGDNFEWAGLQFEVVDMDGNRIDKVLVTPPVNDGQPSETTYTEKPSS
jgi:putative hemolysin